MKSSDKPFSAWPKFFISVDSQAETVTFDCMAKDERKSVCKNHLPNEDELYTRILSCLHAHVATSEQSHKRAALIASNCLKHDTRFKNLGFLDKETLDDFMRDTFPSLADVKPKNVHWKRFLRDVASVYKNNTTI